MVKHIVAWCFKEEVPAEDRKAAAERIKEGLEGLVGVIPGLVSAKVITETLESSTQDLALLSEFETAEDLKAYSTNPDHVKVATFVRSVTCKRASLDYEM